MDKGELTTGERKLLDWQHRRSGHFYTALWDAIAHADNGNLERLAKGFPEEVEAYRRYATEPGYWQSLNLCTRKEGGGT